MNILSLFLLLALSPALQARSNLRALNLDPNLLLTFPAQSCTEPGTDNACKSLLKNYCEKLDANNGTVTDSFGTIKRGASARSQLSEAERSDLSQLAQSFDALPEDLKPALRAPYTRLQQALEREQDSREWYREISNIRGEISLQVGHLASARAAAALEQRLPPGKRPTERDIEAEDRHQTGLLMDQITAAKISSGPHWTRIQEVFVKVKADMRRVIEALPLTSEERTQRLQAIDATELSFPLPIRAGSGRLAEVLNKDCRSTMNNANYFAVNGKISICAGLANQFTTENTLYFVLSHELAHSFNAGILASRHPLPTDPAEKMITRLIETNSTLDCGEWNQLKTAAMTPTATPNCSSSRYQGLVSCLNTAGTSSIKDSESAESGQVKSLFEAVPFCQLTEKAEGLAYMNPTEFSNRHSAAMLSQLSGGAEYVGPDLEGFGRFFPVAYHITQQLRCNENMSCQQVIAEVQANSYPAPRL